MRKNVNNVTVRGKIFQHNLQEKTVKDQNSKNYGVNFISGDLSIATDNEGLNIIPVHYTYVAPTYPSGKRNSTYTSLKKILESGKTWVEDGPEDAWIVACDTSLALNDFVASDGTMVSAKRADGGFVTLPAMLKSDEVRNKFSIDMLITQVVNIEEDPERGIDKPYAQIKGYVFDFRNNFLPVDFNVHTERGIAWLNDQEITQNSPLYSMVRGHIECSTVKVEHREENAFGDAEVTYTERNRREWVVDSVNPVFYELGDEDVMTKADIEAGIQAREIRLAEVKKRDEDYKASRANTTAAPATAPTAPATAPTADTKRPRIVF